MHYCLFSFFKFNKTEFDLNWKSKTVGQGNSGEKREVFRWFQNKVSILLKLSHCNTVQVFFSTGEHGNVITLDGSCQQAYNGRYLNLEPFADFSEINLRCAN